MLEQSVIDTLLRFGLHGERIKEHPGVWVKPYGMVGMRGKAPKPRKVCAVGVHMRRNVASFGIGFNVETDLKWFKGITACGLPGDRTTSLKEEGVNGVSVGHVRNEWVNVMKDNLKVTKVGKVDWRDVMNMASGDVSAREAMGGRAVY